MPSIVAKLTNESNRAYAEALKAEFERLPLVATRAALREVYTSAVKNTVQDSGLAVYNWWIAIGDDTKRLHQAEKGVGIIGLPGERRSSGRGDLRAAPGSQKMVNEKMEYMNKTIRNRFSGMKYGATVYNMTPVKDEDTFKGTYQGNAKIRIAVEFGILRAERAAEAAMNKIDQKVK